MRIKSNETLIKQIVAGEMLFQPYLNMVCLEAFDGDYTYLIVSQVKAMGSYFKEFLHKNFLSIFKRTRLRKTHFQFMKPLKMN
jgi:hypothetical protein